MDDTWFEIPELAAQVRERVPGAFVKATYSSGPSHLEQTGSPASIWIGIFNSSLNDGPLAAMETMAVELVPLGLAWLAAHDFSRAETTVMIAFGDGSEGPVLSWSNILETVRFVIGKDKALTRILSGLSAADEEFFREMRYRGSGRDMP
jgi:hypothetical protein